MNIMKKTYRTPKVIVAHISGTETILAGSGRFSIYNDQVEGTSALSKGNDHLWDEDEDEY